ncbi:MAG: hypothetical protein SPL10_05575 [Synergistales bacterium]|nr:hypothetical protein [Synergistales bacterium]MDY6400822.1 hypothetical protein [Synergistales bacterium]MDY6405470.1 hypothetical protein [Synergistales bacterium]MDY6410477.1 hypothetical protein [Synergistales bacterium]MDY6414615.1 hypothetical protein [Synergistales bacterium]
MKKIFLAMLLIFLLSSISFGAVSEDMSVYLRKDVFDAKIEALFNRLHAEIGTLKTELRSEIGSLRTELKSEIGDLRGDVRALSARIDGLEKRVDDMHDYVYWFIVAFLAVLALPFFNRWLERREEKKISSFVTLDEVKRLIAEANFRGGISS